MKLKKIVSLIVISSIVFTGCSKVNNDNKSNVDLTNTLSSIDYIVNARYIGKENIDFAMIQKVCTVDTYNSIAAGLSIDIKPYINVTKQYKEAEKAFNNYKERIEGSVKKDEAAHVVVNEHTDEYEEQEESQEQQIEIAENAEDIKMGMLYDIYNAEGQLVWSALMPEDLEDVTEEDIKEFLQIAENAYKSVKEKAEEKAEQSQREIEQREEQQRLDEQRKRDEQRGDQAESDISNTEINMEDFPTDERIQQMDGDYVIMLEDIEPFVKELKFQVYGMNYSIDITNLGRPLSYCKDNELYNFKRTYYALYDNNKLIVSYSSRNDSTNQSKAITLEVDIVNGLINISNTENITTTKW